MKKKEIIREKKSLKKLFNKTNRKNFLRFAFFVSTNDLPYSRFLISVSKQVGCAVIRNKIKRRVRVILDLIKNEIPKGYDFAFIFKCRLPSCDISLLLLEEILKTIK